MYILLAEILIVSALLLIGYRLLLERRTDFLWCRLYLVVLPLLSVVIPLLEIPLWPAKAALMPVITIGEGGAVVAAEVVTEQAPIITLAGVVLSLYCTGVVALIVLLVYQFWRIRRLERDAEVGYVDGVRVVRTSATVASFSFFRTIYVNRNTSAEDFAVIIKHECSHIAHRHSFERLAMELQKALLWWNPFVWMAARLLTEVEEFEADRDVLCGGEDRTIYIQTIFKQMFGYSPEIANSLRDSLTKKRLIMMTTNFRSRYARLRQVAIVPLMLALVVAFGTTVRAQEQDGKKKTRIVMASNPEMSNPIYLVDGKVVENIEDVDALMIASLSVFKNETEELKERLQGTAVSVEEVKKRGIVIIKMIKPENFVADGEEAEYSGVVCDWDNNPIVGAEVKEGERSVVTDINGRFKMRATCGEVGQISYFGYQNQPIHFTRNKAEVVLHLSKQGEEMVFEFNDAVDIQLSIEEDSQAQPNKVTAYSISNGKVEKVNADVVAEVVKSEQMPSFQGGGLQDFRAWVMTQVRFPQEMLDKGVYGRVMAAFVVDTEGSVSNINIVQTPDKAFSDEVIRVLNKSPKWKAGKSGGKPVSVKYAVPIDFAIHDGEKLKKTEEKAPEASSTTAEEVVVTGFAIQK